MRITSTGFKTNAHDPIVNAVILVDAFHRRRLGLAMLGHDCEVTETIDDAFDALKNSGKSDVVVIDSRPECFAEIVPRLLLSRDARVNRVTLVMPSYEFFSVHEALDNSSMGDEISMCAVGLDGQLSRLSLTRKREGDISSNSFISGLTLGLGSAETVILVNPRTPPAVRDLEEKLLSVLEARELTAPAKAATTEVTTVPEHPYSEAQEQKIRDLENQLVTATSKMDALQRKYDALANSRLGRMTLKHWERNRRGEN